VLFAQSLGLAIESTTRSSENAPGASFRLRIKLVRRLKARLTALSEVVSGEMFLLVNQNGASSAEDAILAQAFGCGRKIKELPC
jgi:hypothetical protein